MKKLFTTLLLLLPLVLNSAVIDFTGGTVIFGDETLENQTTNGQGLFSAVSRYEENGFFLEYVLTEGSTYDWSQTIGNYYGESEPNDVIHGHWPSQDGNGLDYIKIGKIDGSFFDLEYFALTSNTEIGGGHATGNEKVYIQGFKSNNRALWETEKYLIPGNNWGVDETYNVFLGDDFNEIEWATINESEDPEKTIKSFISKRIKGSIRRAIDINRGAIKIPEHKLNEIRKDNGQDHNLVAMFFNSMFLSIDEQLNDEDEDNMLYQIPDQSEIYNIGLMNLYLISLLKKHLA